MRRVALLPTLLLIASGLVLSASPAQAAGELWKLKTVDAHGCADNAISTTVEFSGLTGGGYTAHTRAYADGKLYMNEGTLISGDGTSDWDIYTDSSYDPGVTVAPFPMPAGKQVTVIMDLEKPKGTVLSSWKYNLDGCNTGNVVYNGLTSGDPDDDIVLGAADKCPAVNGTGRANGCPLLARKVTLKYNAAKGNFAGKITCKAFELRQFQRVVVYRKQPGRDPRIGAAKTGFTAHYRLRRTPAPGKYYAVVKRGIQTDAGEAAKTKSKVLELG